MLLADKLKEKGYSKVIVKDLARCDMAEAVAEAFRYSKLVLATTTYNAGIFPFMREFIGCLTERNFSNRTVAFMENGSWAIIAAKIMKEQFEKSKGLIFADTSVRIVSVLNEENIAQIERLADELKNLSMEVM
jgi:flavorubredoxin